MGAATMESERAVSDLLQHRNHPGKKRERRSVRDFWGDAYKDLPGGFPALGIVPYIDSAVDLGGSPRSNVAWECRDSISVRDLRAFAVSLELPSMEWANHLIADHSASNTQMSAHVRTIGVKDPHLAIILCFEAEVSYIESIQVNRDTYPTPIDYKLLTQHLPILNLAHLVGRFKQKKGGKGGIGRMDKPRVPSCS